MTDRITLAITTHARADALARVLAGVRAQTRTPDEVIVAEDGEDPATAAVVSRHAAAPGGGAAQLHHLRQPHHGFRVARLRNLAIAAATGDYVVFIDGDMLPHPEFLDDHARCARRGRWTQGVRVPLDAATTRTMLAGAGVALDGVGDGAGDDAPILPGRAGWGRHRLRRRRRRRGRPPRRRASSAWSRHRAVRARPASNVPAARSARGHQGIPGAAACRRR